MINNQTTPNSFGRDKDKYLTQYEVTYNELRKRPQTMLEVSTKTGILRANVCRYVSKMREGGLVEVVYHDVCSISKHPANHYTTDPELFPPKDQLTLFEV